MIGPCPKQGTLLHGVQGFNKYLGEAGCGGSRLRGDGVQGVRVQELLKSGGLADSTSLVCETPWMCWSTFVNSIPRLSISALFLDLSVHQCQVVFAKGQISKSHRTIGGLNLL